MARILLVERDPLVCVTVAEALRYELQAEVACATSAAQAAQMLAATSFDLSLISVMKDFSGFAVADLAANENIPVLLMSGNVEAQSRLRRYRLPLPAEAIQSA